MPVKFECPKCRSRLTVASRYAGRRGRCPKCRAKIDVPDFEFAGPNEDGIYEINDGIESAIEPESPRSTAAVADAQPGTSEQVVVRSQAMEPEENVESLPADESDSTTKVAKTELRSKVSIPRWVIYVQGALLGIVASSFFVFGLMIGLNTQSPGDEVVKDFQTTVTGSVYYDDGIYRRADFEAVVIWLPADAKPNPRPDGSTLTPESFMPLNNPSIEMVRELGGAVVRVDDDASYQVTLDGNKNYWVLVVSKNKRAEPGRDIPKGVRAELGAYFFPIEDVISDRAFDWSRSTLRSRNEKRKEVVF